MIRVHPLLPSRSLRRCAAMLALAWCASASTADIDWAARTRGDIEAMDTWVRGAYAGAVDPDNVGFAPSWQSALALAQSRAVQVHDVAGWRATVQALVNSARDGHLYVYESATPGTALWAGLALEQRGDRYLARRPTALIAGIDLRVEDGAELLSCDGLAAAHLLPQRLDLYVTDWRIAAQRAMHASHLFVDRGNPFAPSPSNCRLRSGTREFDVALRWTQTDVEQLDDALRPFSRVKSQREHIGIEFARDGSAWLAVGSLGDYAALTRLAERVSEQREQLLRAPYLVWDLRGNGGGDSSLAEGLARALWGDDTPVNAPASAHPKRWRASPLSLEVIQKNRDGFAAQSEPNPRLIEMADNLLQRLRPAMERGETLVTENDERNDTDSARSDERMAQARARIARQPTYLLTDGGCFSSCIIAGYMLKRLGVRQVGDPTGVHTIYGEVWFNRTLPSGLGKLILPLSINDYPPGELGGDTPDLPWHGAAEDEDGLRRMIAGDAARRNAEKR